MSRTHPHYQLPGQFFGVGDIRGEFRLRLYNEPEFQRLQQRFPDWPREYLIAMCLDDDTGWVKNTVTDYARRQLVDNSLTTILDVFIHEGTTPGNVHCSSLQFTYLDQTGNPPAGQIADPSNVFDMDTLLQTRTITFGAPNTQRDINTVGLTFFTTATTAQRALHGIAAYSVLSSTRTQTTVQTADVQYKLTWSFE